MGSAIESIKSTIMIKFGTKAETLSEIGRIGLSTADVLPLVYLPQDQWIEDKERCLNNIQNLVMKIWSLESSSFDRDNISTTNAGAFLSILNGPIAELDTAVEEFFDSYGVKTLIAKSANSTNA